MGYLDEISTFPDQLLGRLPGWRCVPGQRMCAWTANVRLDSECVPGWRCNGVNAVPTWVDEFVQRLVGMERR